MPEVILPCLNKACGGSRPFALKEYTHGVCCDYAYVVRCPSCGMQGPWKRDSAKEAIAAWNALPRALPWTDEPPKVAGVYLIRSIFDGEQQGDVGVITVKTPFDYDKSHFMQFAGPIPAPIE